MIKISQKNANNGSCTNPAPPTPDKIGVGHSRITAFPGCSETPAGEGENSYCEPPPSSSSSPPESSSSDGDEPSSSSYDEPSSSSEKQEEADCYASYLEASAAYDGMVWKCVQAGNIPNFRMDSRKCISGECMERSSSSEGASSSSSGGSGDSQCLASKPFLQKPVNYYDDWVYIGKERYGSRKASRRLPTLGIKYFDALGRIYEEIMGRKMYYTKEPLVEAYEIPLDFEVYARIVKDSEGNDIQVFIKEDKKNRLRRDSSFYWDGYWEVMENDEVARTIKYRSSQEIKIIGLYDKQWHITSRVMTNKNNDTLASQLYFWKNGRLAKTIFNGVERNFVYGKTLQDTVKVIPSDEGLYFHRGYNNSVGMMPDENDIMYRFLHWILMGKCLEQERNVLTAIFY